MTIPPSPGDLATMHRRCFGAAPPPWSEDAFAATLAAGAFLVAETEGFALGRVACDEAELLTLAVAPEDRRQGCGTRLLRAFDARARHHGAAEAFLEVAEDNAAARALYAGAGWVQVGSRPAYYGRTAALILRKVLGP